MAAADPVASFPAELAVASLAAFVAHPVLVAALSEDKSTHRQTRVAGSIVRYF